ncbi:hypothetical protein QVD17_15885 [Tagetes erecta]|uniref:Replication protein A 70 kDa DNA-binding subunit B/D first OB fold domain-containing protein n=1 Tax=Tagetes erecta TaxID=13708 RepID=A0AAD8P015_TARER|nr:hypothetical protein QVD17_15885 [Tagetes erecta]
MRLEGLIGLEGLDWKASSSAASELKLSFIADLNPEQDLWNMRARVVKKWRSKYWLDFILIDEKGVKIQAVLKQHLIPLFEHQLEEDNVVLISKFGVGTNTGPFKGYLITTIHVFFAYKLVILVWFLFGS